MYAVHTNINILYGCQGYKLANYTSALALILFSQCLGAGLVIPTNKRPIPRTLNALGASETWVSKKHKAHKNANSKANQQHC